MADVSSYDLILVGSSFSSAFFLHRYLELAGAAPRRVLWLERGPKGTHEWYRTNESRIVAESRATVDHTRSGSKHWDVRNVFGGASLSWWACTPRLLPEDFELRSRYGVGADWPITYDELEEHYCAAEEIMLVSGSDDSPSPRSRPYPAPPHLLSDPDGILKKAWGPLFVSQPCARARFPTPRGRARCCAQGVCHACPVDSKFTVVNELDWLSADPRVQLVTGATVQAVETRGSVAAGVVFDHAGDTSLARGELVVLGAGAIFNPAILLRSGLRHPQLGRGLCEQLGVFVEADLADVDGFQGSTAITGHGYPFYSGPHRADHAACLIETWNVPELRNERGRYRRFLRSKLIFEDFRRAENRVELPGSDSGRPAAIFSGPSEHTRRALQGIGGIVSRFLRPLRLENPPRLTATPTEGHILGTVVMGRDPTESVVDRHLVHHAVRNLVVLGGSAFPTAAPANPTLTISALSLFSAQSLFGRGGR